MMELMGLTLMAVMIVACKLFVGIVLLKEASNVMMVIQIMEMVVIIIA